MNIRTRMVTECPDRLSCVGKSIKAEIPLNANHHSATLSQATDNVWLSAGRDADLSACAVTYSN